MTEPVNKPLQARSQATLDRIVEATESLLQTNTLRQISIAQIVALSKTSTGSFYARFKNKESLLPALYCRYEASLDKELEAFETNEADSLEAAIDSVVDFIVKFFSRRKNLLRALAIYVREAPEAVDHESRIVRQSQFSVIHKSLLRFSKEIQHSNPERAIQLAIYMITCLCRDQILFASSTHAASVAAGDDELKRETAAMALGYLLTGHNKK